MRYRIRRLAFLALLGLVVTGCSEPVRESPRLRILNYGEHDIEGLTVGFPDSHINFGDVPAGATTAYKDAPHGVYRYGAYGFRVHGLRRRQPVTDFMGEAPMPAGSYTFVISFVPDRFPRGGAVLHTAVLRNNDVILPLDAIRDDLDAEDIRQGFRRISFGEKFEVEGLVYRHPEDDDCWFIRRDGGWRPLEFDELPPNFRVNGMRVHATVHMVEDEFGKCSHFIRVFVDAIEAAG